MNNGSNMVFSIKKSSVKNCISCYLAGGLGNQLFQIFTTMAYSMRNNKKMILPYSEVLTTGIARPTYWETFLSSLKKYTVENEENLCTNDDLSQFLLYREPSFHFYPLPVIEQNLLLYGYYQSYKYFEKEKESIFSAMHLREQQSMIMLEFPQYSVNNEDYYMISMHFRLGDYKEKQKFHPVMPYEYYDNALFRIFLHKPTTNPYRVLVFCEAEDSEVVESMVQRLREKYRNNVIFEKVDISIPDWKQLLIMSCCNSHIIANSSFSWWAAYMNESLDPIVCYPDVWFGPAIQGKSMRDMFPERWIQIRAG